MSIALAHADGWGQHTTVYDIVRFTKVAHAQRGRYARVHCHELQSSAGAS